MVTACRRRARASCPQPVAGGEYGRQRRGLRRATAPPPSRIRHQRTGCGHDATSHSRGTTGERPPGHCGTSPGKGVEAAARALVAETVGSSEGSGEPLHLPPGRLRYQHTSNSHGAASRVRRARRARRARLPFALLWPKLGVLHGDHSSEIIGSGGRASSTPRFSHSCANGRRSCK